MPNPLQIHGSQQRRPTRFAPIFTNRFFQGLWTQRNPLRDGSSNHFVERFYGTNGDALIGGLNMEVTNRLTLKRRPGSSVYNSVSFPRINSFYEFRQFHPQESISVLADTQTAIFDVTGPNTNNVIWSKNSNAGPAYFQSVNSRLYFGDGAEVKKYLRVGGGFAVQNWGIAAANVPIGIQQTLANVKTASTGNNRVSPPVVFYNPFNPTPSPGIAWSNPSNVNSSSSYATATVPADGQSYTELLIAGFDWTGIPTNTVVTGVTVTFSYYSTAPYPPSLAIFLYDTVNGNIIGNAKWIQAPYPTTSTTITLGGEGDLWGSQVAIAIANNNLGVGFQAVSNGQPYYVTAANAGSGFTTSIIAFPEQSATHNIGNVVATLNLAATAPSVTANQSSSGALTPLVGYQYVYCYGNSVTGHVSTPSPASTRTQGGQVIANYSFSIQPSSDPQVDLIRVFRTVDGGSTFYELPTSPYQNTPGVTLTVSDAAADSSLQLLNIAPAPSAIIPVGNNNPPPQGLINLTFHLGRIWGSESGTGSAGKVWYSRTTDGTVGVPYESFPAFNWFEFPSQVTRLVPTVLGLLVFTNADIYIIVGDGVTTQLTSAPFLKRIGLSSYNALTVNGSTIYMMTSDSQVLQIDPGTGVSEIGFPIGDQFEDTVTSVGNLGAATPIQYHPSTAYVTWHVSGSSDKALYVGDGASGWFRWTLTAAPEAGFTWSPYALVTGGCGAVQSVETSPGNYQLLIGPSSLGGPILFRDTTVFTDNGNAFSANVQIGSIILAHPGQMAELAFIATDSVATGTRPAVGVRIDEISGDFQPLHNYSNDPPLMPASSSIYANRYYFSQNPDVTAWCRHMQIQFSWPAEAFGNELLTYTLMGAHWQES